MRNFIQIAPIHKGVTDCTITGIAYVAKTKKEIANLPEHQILVTQYATPDLVEYFQRAKAIATDHGGATSHAANIARQRGYVVALGLGEATKLIQTGDEITIEIKNGLSRVILKGT
ncbi:MAG: PEP-utilizing enzyme [archaeon]